MATTTGGLVPRPMTSREVLELLLVRTYAEADALQAEAESARAHGAVRAAKLRAVRAAHLRAQARDIGGHLN
jgi:hypothetical protein